MASIRDLPIDAGTVSSVFDHVRKRTRPRIDLFLEPMAFDDGKKPDRSHIEPGEVILRFFWLFWQIDSSFEIVNPDSIAKYIQEPSKEEEEQQ